MTANLRHGRVVVLYGGDSAERDVSLMSGKAVLDSLTRSGLSPLGYDTGGGDLSGLEKMAPDKAFIALHGRGGEDGTLQGALELMGIPYTGSGVLASAVGMDKIRTKWLWLSQGLPTPDSVTLDEGSDLEAVVERLGLPLIVKPVHEGSTLGITIVETIDALKAAYHDAVHYDNRVMAEEFIKGEEYTVSVLGDTVLPAIRVEVPSGFYDYEAKYVSNDTLYHLPSGLSEADEAELAGLCQRAFQVVGCEGWGRVDVMRDAAGRFWLIEVNTSPGMTDHSLVPQAAAYMGIDFDHLVLKILDTVGSR